MDLHSQSEKVGLNLLLLRYLQNRWEVAFFLVLYCLLTLQVLLFYNDIHDLSSIGRAIVAFAAFESFVVHRVFYVVTPATLLPLLCLLFLKQRPSWARKYLDALGVYAIFRMVIQLIGLNILVFDVLTSRFLLITQLLFFLPYSLLIWGWIYWRLDSIGRNNNRPLFRVDCESDCPRPLDYFVASFTSVFSASISGIKGRLARARILILLHGIVIFNVMGLTFSRAVALVQSK